jgi:membrane protease YdiL (CAAX protease family)
VTVTTVATRRTGPVALLLAGFGIPIALRVVVGGGDVARSAVAGTVFAVALLALSRAAGTRVALSWRAAGIGLAGAAVLCVPVLLRWTPRPPVTEGFARWALVVGFVAVAEEVFLRGTLYDAVRSWTGEDTAIGVGAVAFALLHVPLYGWHVVPLDLAVGVLLGELRRVSGTAGAPAVTHVCADLAAWFLRS